MTQSAEGDTASGCAVCGGDCVDLVAAFTRLPRATSDCRPFPAGGKLGVCAACRTVQKPADAQWDADAKAIYRRYDIFRQAAGGAEQRVFDQTLGTSLRRSEAFIRRLQDAYPFPPVGRALDVGCGNGPTLRALAELAPRWKLYGHDLSGANAAVLAAIRGFETLYTGGLADIPGHFDLITLTHSLEHFANPVDGLSTLRGKLSPGGRLLVEVPDVRQNIYDLVVADHRTHFDLLTLGDAARRAGFGHVTVFDNWAFKELTLLASNAPLAAGSPARALPALRRPELSQHVAWLASVVDAATDSARRARSFGLFGTAIAATWLFGPLAEHVSFFVDEDAARIGQEHEGRPILATAGIPRGATVFVPLVPDVAAAVAERLEALGVDARVPPPADPSRSEFAAADRVS